MSFSSVLRLVSSKAEAKTTNGWEVVHWEDEPRKPWYWTGKARNERGGKKEMCVYGGTGH